MKLRSKVAAATMSDATNNVGRMERFGSVALGAALLAYGLRKKRASGAAQAAAGAALMYRGATGHCPVYERMGMTSAHGPDTRAALSGSRGFHVNESIRIELPVSEVYQFWRDIENLPQFMSHLERVIDLGNGHSHWVAKGPAGMAVEWDAEIINEVPNKVIGWRSLPASEFVTAGSVNFDDAGTGGTLLTVHLQYAPPAGRLGKLVSQIFGDEPSQAIAGDLRRLKRLLEARESKAAPVAPGVSEPGL